MAFQIEMCLLHYTRPKKKMLSRLPTMTLKPRGMEGATNRNWASQGRFSKTVVPATRPEAGTGIVQCTPRQRWKALTLKSVDLRGETHGSRGKQQNKGTHP